MTVANPYFLYPYSIDAGPSDVVAIDNTGGTTGPLSYQYGFTPNYEEDLSTIPSSFPVPRPQFNQLMLDITSAIQQIQLAGAPIWVAPASGSPPVGGPVSYPLYARVAYTAGAPYGFQIWESQVAGNTSIPGDDDNWVPVSGARGIAAGTYIDSASPNGYIGALLCDGTAYSRSTYAQLFTAITFTASCTTHSSTSVDVPPNVIALVSALIAGNSQACYVEGSNISNGTYITAVGATTITLSAAASSSGTFTLRFLPYGQGNGSSTFNVPDCLRTVNVASGGSGNTVLGNKLGNRGGSDTYTMALTDIFNHTHNYALPSPGTALGGNLSGSTRNLTPNLTTTPINGRAQTGDTNSDQTAMNIIQQSTVVFRYIKY